LNGAEYNIKATLAFRTVMDRIYNFFKHFYSIRSENSIIFTPL